MREAGSGGRATRAALLGALLLLSVALAGTRATADRSAASAVGPPLRAASSAAPSPAGNPIRHVIVIDQENHTFDNYFGTYPGADGIPPGACMPWDPRLARWGCVKPYRTIDPTSPDMPHEWFTSHVAYDGGRGDGFLPAEGYNRATMSYYDYHTIPLYWDMAREYVLCDRFFSSALSYSTPNHWYLIAADTPSAALYYMLGGHRTLSKPVPPPHHAPEDSGPAAMPLPGRPNPGPGSVSPAAARQLYLAEAAAMPTLMDRMGSRVSWKLYDYPLRVGGFWHAVGSGQAFDYWNPLAAKKSSYTAAQASHFAARNRLFADLAHGRLPTVAWVIPDQAHSEHPPYNIVEGELWVTRIVDAVEQSPYWRDTVIFITWDDYGGFYDHVPPPALDANGLSFRVPCLVISAYAKEDYVDHTQYSFESIMKFIEWRFGLTPLTSRDGNANNMLNAFDFSRAPRPPIAFPLRSRPNAYPMPLQPVRQP